MSHGAAQDWERIDAIALAEEIARFHPGPDRLPAPANGYLTPAGLLRRASVWTEARGGAIVRIGRTHEGRGIYAFQAGQESAGGILILALLHAMEWIAPLALLACAERSDRGDPATPIALVPVANPDGAERAAAHAVRRRIGFARANARGVDLNRNFPSFHRGGGIWARLPWYRPGPRPESEPEVAAIATLARRIRPRVSLSFHSFGRRIFYPPAHGRGSTELADRHRSLLERIPGGLPRGYKSGALGRWSIGFRAYGTEIDFLAHEIDSLAFLIEVSGGGIGRWGLRRIAVPFFAFNPPEPERELVALAPFCGALLNRALG